MVRSRLAAGVALAACGLLFLAMSFREDLNMGDGALHQHAESTPFGNKPFAKYIVHIDLKGAPPRVSYIEWVLPLLAKMKVSGLLMEYEDTFPFSGNLSSIRSNSGYEPDDMARILKVAKDNQLEIIPLVQTFGHMEFVLKHNRFNYLKENRVEDDSICPSDENSINLIRELIRQMRVAHPDSTRIHIGSDEAYHVAEDKRCLDAVERIGGTPNRAVETLKLRHIARVARVAREQGFTEVFAWNDMFQSSSIEDMHSVGIGDLITPVVWGYATDVLRKDYFPDGLFDRLSKVFSSLWFATAYKGANGQSQVFIDLGRYLTTHKSYVHLYRKFYESLTNKVSGVILTGWQRFRHRAPLCELLPIALPSLVMDIVYMDDITAGSRQSTNEVKRILNCSIPTERRLLRPKTVLNATFYPEKDALFADCQFNGSELFGMIMKDYRFLLWKVNKFGLQLNQELLTEMGELRKNMRTALYVYYHEDTVQEVIQQLFGWMERRLTNLQV